MLLIKKRFQSSQTRGGRRGFHPAQTSATFLLFVFFFCFLIRRKMLGLLHFFWDSCTCHLMFFWASCTCYSMFPLDLVFACYYDMSSSVRRCFMRVLCLSSVVEFSTEFAIFLSELQRIIIFNLLLCHSIGQSIFSSRQLSFIYKECMPYCCSELLIIDNKKTVECVCVCVCVLYFCWL